MKSELIVDVQPTEIAIAFTEDGRLQEISREKRDEDNYAVGNIYYGRVKKVMPALNAAFVDVGYEKEAFLHYPDLGDSFLTMRNYVTRAMSNRKHQPMMEEAEKGKKPGKEGTIGDYLQVGDMLLVQVTKEPINTKGPRVTAEISMAGRNIVLIPFADKVMVSQKIRKESERKRLVQLVRTILPTNYGVIIRTVAEGKRSAELDNELKILLQRWEDTVHVLQHPEQTTAQKLNKDAEVRLVSEELGRTTGIIRDVFTPDFATIQVNDRQVYNEVLQYVRMIAPESASIVKFYNKEQPIFDHYDITRQIKTGLGRIVGFGNGGYLTMDKTEALFSIDVNSGSKKLYEDQEENAFQFNLLAAYEIAHQLRLRDIGGIIIVDFIDMDSKENQQKLYEHVRKLMNSDRARHNILPLSKFGLMQITRQRVRPAVEMDVTEVCPMCQGKGKVQPTLLFTDTVENEIEHMVSHYGKGLRLELHPYVFAYINKGLIRTLRHRWEWRYGVKIRENQSLGMLEMRFTDTYGNEIIHKEETDPDSKE
ncbi:MAG: Rne/Rng family ribonuclease [Paludibacteraceae bacterium]|nr:Rne/Rng family ribonuclease [Paludibacteraceae bacterium]